MSLTSLHTLYMVQVGAAQVHQIQEFSIDEGTRRRLSGGDGNIDPTHATVDPAEPGLSFTTTALAVALAAIGIRGLKIETGATLLSWWQKMMDRGAGPAAGSVHPKREITNGIIVPGVLSARRVGPATLSYTVVILGDGVNDPIKRTANQALPAITGDPEKFTVGPLYINGTLVNGEQDFDLDFGFQLNAKGGGGENFPSHVTVGRREPALRFLTLNAALEDLIGSGGAAAISSTTVAYLRKKAGAGNVADNVAEHISLAFNAGLAQLSPATASHGAEAQFPGGLAPISDGANDIVAINTATTIP